MKCKIIQLPNKKFIALFVEYRVNVTRAKRLFREDEVKAEYVAEHRAITKRGDSPVLVDIQSFDLEGLSQEHQFHTPQLAEQAIHNWVKSNTTIKYRL